MGTYRRHKILSMEGIVGAMRPDRKYQCSNLATSYGVRTEHIRRFMEQAANEGLVDRVKRNGDTCYMLVWSKPEEVLTPAPYRTARLAENLTGYDQWLGSHQLLAMATRK